MGDSLDKSKELPIYDIKTDYSSYRIADDGDDDNVGVVKALDNMVRVTVTTSPDIVSTLSSGMSIGVRHNYIQRGADDTTAIMNKTESSPIIGVNESENSFAFLVPLYMPLTISRAYKFKDATGLWGPADETYLLIYCDVTHLFSYDESKTNTTVNEGVLGLRLTIGEDSVLYDWDDSMYNGNTRLIIPWSEDFDILVPELLNDDERLTTPLDITSLRLERTTPDFLHDDNYTMFVDTELASIGVPILNKESAEGNKSILLNERFVDDVRKKAVNPGIDMERDVYHPVWVVNGKTEMIYDIVFNFHFREHRGENWLVKDNSMWNGVADDNKLMNSSDSEIDPFFSNDEPSRQSDLLSYLGFNNNDVRFQKNRLTKSFIRLLFYDSPKTSQQNLLYTSTVYFNTNELFAKYMRQAETSPYSYTREDDDTVLMGLTGIDVSREPYGFDSDTDSEDLRLSSQIRLKDKISSKGSSDGFYMYLWKESDNGTEAQDIYLKVEFNHAGYGRTIPFMMPYYDKVKHGSSEGRIKSFEDIVKDFNGTGDDKPYGIRQYQKFAYIHMKYRYDGVLDKHIFYLDKETYGDARSGASLAYDANTLYLNLYEAKIDTETIDG